MSHSISQNTVNALGSFSCGAALGSCFPRAFTAVAMNIPGDSWIVRGLQVGGMTGAGIRIWAAHMNEDVARAVSSIAQGVFIGFFAGAIIDNF